MSWTPRHKACKPCRDRKVRCNGQQPVCEKCQRLGEKCFYSPSQNPSKADLAQTIEILRDRVDTAEALIIKQTQPIKTSGSSNNSTPPAVQEPMTNFDNPDFSPSNLQFPFPSDAFMTSDSNRNSSQSTFQFYSGLDFDHDILNGFPSPHATGRNDLFSSPFQVYDLPAPEEQVPGGKIHQHIRMPSLREIRALNSSPSTSPVSPLSMTRGDKNEPGTDSQRLISELTTFSLAVFATQTEIAGISSAVAEYLAWVRKAARGSPRENYEGVLETLETRIRELHEIAQTRHQAAWKQMVNVLEKLEGVAPQLSVFERELVLRTAEKAHFFQAEYDICVPMPEQKAKI